QILAARAVPPEPDEDMVLDYLLWDARFVDRTFFRAVKAIPPGHVLVARKRAYRLEAFRPAALAPIQLSSMTEYWAEYRRRFEASVTARIESRTPVVAELSGGLDSSSIVCTADRLLRGRPAPFPSLVAAAGLYPGLGCDEEPFIRAVAAHVRIP